MVLGPLESIMCSDSLNPLGCQASQLGACQESPSRCEGEGGSQELSLAIPGGGLTWGSWYSLVHVARPWGLDALKGCIQRGDGSALFASLGPQYHAGECSCSVSYCLGQKLRLRGVAFCAEFHRTLYLRAWTHRVHDLG